MDYRQEIDGLRALAVLPVIFFHAGYPGFSGGYVGVDIFFVISGYLITSIIIGEVAADKFSIINFYERRARRILPALIAMLTVTTVAAFMLMSAESLREYSQSLVSVMAFASNIFFYLESGYFSTMSDEKPLLHTWSLAVEEQYYLFFPLMVLLLWPMGKRLLFGIITIISVMSLMLAQWLADSGEVNFNFYLIFSRAWELFLGSLLAFIPIKQMKLDNRIRDLLATSGLVMVIYSIVNYTDQTPFPSIYALVPVVGTCIIIAFSSKQTFIGKLLSWRPFVLVGLISYSLYLWHQSLFAFLRLKHVGEPSFGLFAIAIILTFAFATFSWRYVEQPFRDKTKTTRKQIFTYSAAAVCVFSVIGLMGHTNKGYHKRFDVENYTASIEHSPKRRECHTRGEDYLAPQKACQYFKPDVEWAVFGDSHMVEIAYSLGRRLESYDKGLLHLTFSGCPPLLLDVAKPPGCTDWLNEAVNLLVENDKVKNVVLGFRHSKHLYGSQLDTYPHIPHENPSVAFADKTKMSAEQASERYWHNFRAIISLLKDSGKRVFIMYPIPELPIDVHKALSPISVFSNTLLLDPLSTIEVEYYRKRNAFIISKLNDLKYSRRLIAIKPAPLLCGEQYCSAVKQGNALYFDDNHLSLKGAETVVDSIKL